MIIGGKAKAAVKQLTDTMNNMTDEKWDKVAAEVRLKQYPRWCEMAGVDTFSVDLLEIPAIHVEWLLCDFRNQAMLMNGHREAFLEQLTEAEKEEYLHGPGNYTKIETTTMGKAVKQGFKHAMTGKRGLTFLGKIKNKPF